MTVRLSAHFDEDVDSQFDWYLSQRNLDYADALQLAMRFADAVDNTLGFLSKNSEAGWLRLKSHPELRGTRSWKVDEPFHRFLVFYHIEGDDLFADRLLEGHSRLAGEL